ncbi:MAG: diacylglycerol kinase [Rhodobacteraceae bacterium]|jgi:diacylglycerol kinase family enzyme|nr:diacylglycerol kinase [Paracoccaceae bacterium]
MDTSSAARMRPGACSPRDTVQAPPPLGHKERTDRVCILLNGAAGRAGPNGAAAAIREHAAAGDAAITLRDLTGDAGGTSLREACRTAADEGFGVVAAAGGDGTAAALAACLAGTGVPMGLVPLGTFNYYARANGIPEDIGAALEVLRAGQAAPRDAAYVNGHLFLNNASVGIYPRILADREAFYRRWGRSRLAAYWSVVRTVSGFRRSRRMKVTVDGRPYRARTPLVFVAFNAFQLDAFGLAGADCVRAGEFAVFVAPDCGRFGLIRFAAKLLLRGMRRGRDFELLHGHRVEIDTVDPRHRDRRIAIDGEKVWLEPPFRFRIERGALILVVPADETVADPAGPTGGVRPA